MSASRDEVQSTTNQTFLSALILNSVIAGAQILGFILIRRYFRKVYQPRSYLPSPDKRSDELQPGLLSWIPQICMADSQQIIHKNGLDAYCFVRFLRLITLIFAPAFLVSWAVLLPVYGANTTGTKSGLDRFTFGNIGQGSQNRLPGPLVFAYCFTFYVLFLVQKELRVFIKIRQDYLTSKKIRTIPRSRTILLTGIPDHLMTKEQLFQLTSYLPNGGAREIWLVRDLKDLPDAYDRLQAAFNKLESGYTKLISVAHKANSKSKKSPASDKEVENGKKWSQYVDQKQRPTHRLGFLGLFGKKVDTIEWATQEYQESSQGLNGLRDKAEDYKTENSAFVEFHSLLAAHMFSQSLVHHQPLVMTEKWVGVSASDVIWSTLGVKPFEQRVRGLISWSLTIGLIVFWSIPVAFVGLISNVNSLCSTVSWMGWLCRLPVPVPGLLQGALPPAMLAVLFMLLPIVLRQLAIFQAIPLRSLVELSLMSRYFLFLVIHGFLVVTLSSGLVAAIPAITQQPGSAVTILANELPKASTFFLTYIVATCFAGAAASLLQIASVFIYKLKLMWLASTPRSVYQTRFQMSSVAWGTIFPNVCLLAVIGLSYSTVSPILNGFVTVGFALFWFVYKYLFIYVMDISPSGETGGKFLPMALQHLFVGLYIGEIFLCGLFFLSQDSQGNQSGVVEGALMVALIVLTILFNMLLKKEFFPLIDYLSISLGGDAVPEESFEGETDKAEKREVERSSENSDEPIVGRSHNVRLNEDEQGFDHPALCKPIGTVWIPRDELKISDEANEDMSLAGIKSSSDGARFDSKSKRVFVNRNPPDFAEVVEIPEED
ncbi:hypothetical protein BY996DRAFT_6832998 [Phakopsora pachyrhizi]|nr:hypothetical protein BY996DRAFT_6832998 [Phakopsora pachyrhizi]